MLAAARPAGAADWPHWRGPAFDGQAPDTAGLLAREPMALRVLWKRPLGIAYSGISIARGRAVTMSSDGKLDYVVALDAATGATIWQHVLETTVEPEDGSEGGAKSVPAIDGDLVFALGPKGLLLALRLEDGSEVWRLRIDDKLGGVAPPFGFATSPLVVGDVLIVQVGGGQGRSVVGLDKRTGKVVWSSGDDSAQYGSPIQGQLAGVEQVVSVTEHLVSGVDAATGKIHWSSKPKAGGVPTAVLLGDDRLLITGADRSVAYRVRRAESGFAIDELWTTRDLKNLEHNFATPVVHQGYVYGYSGSFLTCVSANDGKVAWKSRPPGGFGLILVDGRLVILDKDGGVVVADASPAGYREVTRVDVFDRTSYAYPSFADGKIFVRNTKEIAAVGVAPGAAP